MSKLGPSLPPNTRVLPLKIHHGINRPIDHYGYLVEMDGMRWVHFGDTEIQPVELKNYRAHFESPIEVAFLPFWMLFNDEWKVQLNDVLPSHKVVAMHIPMDHRRDRFMKSKGGLKGMLKEMQAIHPEVYVFERPGQDKIFRFGSGRGE